MTELQQKIITYLRKFIGDDIEQLASLEDYHFMHWHQGKAQICEPVPLSEGLK